MARQADPLMGAGLADATGTSYAALLHARITGPLGMTDTTLTPDASQRARLMMGRGLGAPPTPEARKAAPPPRLLPRTRWVIMVIKLPEKGR
jgi:CubicO group peptidase (beta-lactamase class C family)